jgi:hypothetical protein
LGVVAVVVVGCLATPAATAQQRDEEARRLVEILEGLEHGLVALERLGLHDEHERLQRVANDVRGELRHQRRRGSRDPGEREADTPWRTDRRDNSRARGERDDRERRRGERTELQVVEGQIGALQLALPALREAERRDAVELVERAIGARKMMLEGRRDEEARRIRERAPGREQTVELLVLAEKIYREFGMNERAASLSSRTEELWPKRQRPRRPAVRSEEAIHVLEVMNMALPALKEAGRHDAAELLQRAIRAREVQLEGRRDRESAHIREQAPTRGQQIELLAFAAELWQQFGHEQKAQVVGELAERMRSSQGRGGLLPRIERLEARVAELESGLQKVRAQLRGPGRGRR